MNKCDRMNMYKTYLEIKNDKDLQFSSGYDTPRCDPGHHCNPGHGVF